MTYLPEHITFTGIDEWTDIDRVLSLSNRYPIEWGFLFSPKRQGVAPRYPSLDVIEDIVDRLPGNMASIAAHLCGGHAREVVAGRRPDLPLWFVRVFERVQINTADPKLDPDLVCDTVRSFGAIPILQCRSHFPEAYAGIEWLFDGSGGRGIVPSSWPTPPVNKRLMVGYAGGLGPDTVVAALAEIAPRHDDSHCYWIDMESAIRTDDRLDLDKCEAVCRAVYDGRSYAPSHPGSPA